MMSRSERTLRRYADSLGLAVKRTSDGIPGRILIPRYAFKMPSGQAVLECADFEDAAHFVEILTTYRLRQAS